MRVRAHHEKNDLNLPTYYRTEPLKVHAATDR